MSFDYDKMKQDLIEHFNVDMSVERNRHQIELLQTRHRAILLGFQFDTMKLGKEKAKVKEAAKELRVALRSLKNIHPIVQRAISNHANLKLIKGGGFGDAQLALSEFREELLAFEKGAQDRKEKFTRVDVEKIAAIELAIRYHNFFSLNRLNNYNGDKPNTITDTSPIFTVLLDAMPIFQVKPTNLKGAYANWRQLFTIQKDGGRLVILSDDGE
jgi:hypothetical protein